MKKAAVLIVAMAMLAFAVPAFLQADVKMGISVGDQGLNSFYLALGDYSKVPQQNVVMVRRQGIPDEELPVVFFLASKAGVPYGEIVKLRLKKWGWLKIALKYRLDPSIFYVPVKGEVKGGIYGKTYKTFNGRPQKQWNKMKLSDEEIVNFVNLRFVSEHHGYTPEEVIKMRDGGKNFVTINNDITVEKAKHQKKKWFWQKGNDDKKGNNKAPDNKGNNDKNDHGKQGHR